MKIIYQYLIMFIVSMSLISCNKVKHQEEEINIQENQALTALNERDYSLAQQLYSELVDQNPGKVELSFGLANSYAGQAGFEFIPFSQALKNIEREEEIAEKDFAAADSHQKITLLSNIFRPMTILDLINRCF